MATKDGEKRGASRTSAKSRDTHPKQTAERASAKEGVTPRSPRAKREATPTPTKRRTAKPTREDASVHIDATAEAELPVTQAAVTTGAEPEPDATTAESATPETLLGLPETLGDDLGDDEGSSVGDDADSAADGTLSSGTEVTGERGDAPSGSQPRWMRRERMPHGNALGMLIERQFSAPGSPCRSYSDLERRSGISREALSRYVTTRSDRRRSPTIDTLVAIADAMHLSLDATCRAAAATAKGTVLASPEAQRERDETISALIGGLSDDQFSAVVELLRQMRPAGAV